MIVESGGRKFDKTPGKFIARIIDVENLGVKASSNPLYKPVNKTAIYWVLNAVDKYSTTGELRTHREEMPTKMTPQTKFKPSRMYEIAEQVFGGAQNIPMPFDDEFFIGRCNEVILIPNGEFLKAAAFLPVPAGVTPPAVPATYVRRRNRAQQGQATTVQGQATTVQGQATTTAQQTYVAPGSVAAPATQHIDDEDIPF